MKYLEKAISQMPEGSIHVTGNKSRLYTYQYVDGNRVYLGNENEGLKKDLIQKEYLKNFLGEIEKIHEILAVSVKKLQDMKKLPSALERMAPDKRALVTPFKMADAKDPKWSRTNAGKADKSTHPYKTAKGDWVRSKTEVIIADMLFMLGVPYIYECRITIRGKIYEPDFYILNCLTGRVVIWEHLGMMDDPSYLARNSQKIMDYLSAGLIFGKDLIFSTESESDKLRTEVIRKMIDDYCLGYACI